MVFFTEPIRRPWRSPNRQQRGISEKKFGVFYRGNENRVGTKTPENRRSLGKNPSHSS